MGGKVSCTLGEVKNRADFIIYWGGNPAECHPRHFTKYSLTQKGKFTPNGRNIDKQGIEPDKKVDRSDDDIKNSRDPQLDAATSSLKQ